MGTFRARFTILSETGGPWNDDPFPPVEYRYIVNATTVGAVNLSIIGSNFFLDGSVTGISFAGLPAGFTPVPPLALTTPAGGFFSGTACATSFSGADGLGSVNLDLDYGLYTKSDLNNHTGGSGGIIADDIPFTAAIDLIALMTITATLNHQIFLVQASVPLEIDLEGEYTALAFSFTMDPVSGSTVNANTPSGGPNDGDLITITSDPDDPDHLRLDQLTLSVACGTVVIATQTETLLEFYIPSSCGVSGGTTVLTATGNGVQFSGSVSLGQLIVLVTNGSGIYVLTPGATSDTLYSSERDGTTREVKIPDPFFKTGFISG